ncbi:hypothetical protein [Methylocystis bryophila]|uniref:hypothetical protein n=1 Tax=Methylocystis bryophila TaxID=655015 RepID=UPI001319F170|nr:hypothetical protein [Methylocystis bryophila]BDV40996.1 hypothetical protein DSM21852_42500 [Methylocystis bryophila]
MRLSDEDFNRLAEMEELHSYFQRLAPDEMVMDLLRLESPKSKNSPKALNQFMSIYRSLSYVCANDKTMNENERSYYITIANVVREALEAVIIPLLEPDLLDRLLSTLISTDYNLAAFGCYPRAVDMLLTQARRPRGPYELSLERRMVAQKCD